MNNFYPEYQDGDSENQEDVVWNELDWYQYLSHNTREVQKLIECYKKVRHNSSGYFEELAKMMGWNSFVFFDIEEHSNDDNFSIESIRFSENEEEAEFDLEPYTIHKNVLYIFSMGLYQLVQEECEQLLSNNSKISAINMWRLAMSLNDGRSNIIMATYSIDVGDYMLAICHLKLALRAMNESLREAGELSNIMPQLKEVLRTLFSLREVFLKVINDCREYDQSEFGESE